jgi:citronellol/citronellal dehydrogenase
MSLSGKTILVSGASRGIGEAIALRAARDGARIALLAKTGEPHPKLPGTIHTAAKAIEEAGGQALPLVGDIRDDEFVARATAETVAAFGGIDIVVNNASAIDLSPAATVGMKKYDLMNSINARGTFSVSAHAIEHLVKAENPHILTMSPPIDLSEKGFAGSTAYTISKYGMSLVTIGLSRELAEAGVAVNSLWPRTAIDTAAVRNLFARAEGGDDLLRRTRKPAIMADAAHLVLTRPSREVTGRFFIDDEVLAEAGQDVTGYSNGAPEAELELSMWSDPIPASR